MTNVRRLFVPACLSLALGACATGDKVIEPDSGDIVDLSTFERESGDATWSANRLIGLEARDTRGEAIGDIDNLVIGTDDRVRAVVVGVGGFLDLGQTTFRVPWNEVRDQVSVDASGEPEHVTLPITGDNYADYETAPDDTAGATGPDAPREWRATEMIGDYVSLEGSGNARYGVVEDLLFDDAGTLAGVVASRSSSLGGGLYNYPYYGYRSGLGFDPGLDTYGLPYSDDDLRDYRPYSTGIPSAF